MTRTSRSGGNVWDDPYPHLGCEHEIWREAVILAMLPLPEIRDNGFPWPWWERMREVLQKLDEGLSILRGFREKRGEIMEIVEEMEGLCDRLDGLIR